MFIPVLLALAGCNSVGFDAVSITPIYGFVDGCNFITVSGHGFGEELSATVGDNPMSDVTQPDEILDEDGNPAPGNSRGYQFTARVPASTLPPQVEGAVEGVGYADVTVYNGNMKDDTVQSDTITGSGAYYYVACPQPGLLTDVQPGADGFVVSGCQILDTHTVRLVDDANNVVAQDVALTHTCGTGEATFAAPALPDGQYWVQLVDGDGAVLSGGAGDYCHVNYDTGVTDTNPYWPGIDSSVYRDTAYGGSAYGCYPITIGGAQ